jgi:ribosome-associated protein
MKSENLALKIATIALEKKGKEIKILNLSGLAFFTDFFVIISGDSDTHIKAISDHIETKLEENKIKIYHKEGYQFLQWVLLDYIDVIVHIFHNETREYYALERLWGDAKIKLIKDEKS